MMKLFLCAVLFSISVQAGQYFITVNFDEASNHLEQVEEREGYPQIPVRQLQWLIPFGEKIKSISVEEVRGGDGPSPVSLPLTPEYLPMCNVRIRPSPKKEFKKGEFYPASHQGRASVLIKHGFRILNLPLYPLRYSPQDHLGIRVGKLIVNIETEKDARDFRRSAALESDFIEVGQMISNAETLSTYPPTRLTRARATYLIVGPEAYLRDLATWELLEEKAHRSITVAMHSLEKIESEFTGKDVQEKVRKAVKQHYEKDGTRFVLLLGNGYATLPTRYFTVGGESIGSDLYFGCFDGDMDLACEVAVGRAPVSSVEEYRVFVRKTLEARAITTQDPQAKRVLLFGEKMDSSTLASDALEKLATGGSAGNISAQGYPKSSAITRLKETSSKKFSASEVVESISKGNFYTINHMGHASSSYCMRFQATDIPKLSNPIGFFGITQGCHPGDMHGPNWAAKLVLHPTGGAFAQIANSSFGWYQPGSSDGPSNRHNQMFYDAVFREGIRELGRANMRAKERLLTQANSSSNLKKVLVETNLFGDPEFILVIPE